MDDIARSLNRSSSWHGASWTILMSFNFENDRSHVATLTGNFNNNMQTNCS